VGVHQLNLLAKVRFQPLSPSFITGAAYGALVFNSKQSPAEKGVPSRY
jgi:hypothetical protein